MKEGFTPLVFGLGFALAGYFFLRLQMSQNLEIEMLASEIEIFLEGHRIESSSHSDIYKTSRELHNLTQRPDRSFLALLAFVIAVRSIAAFFSNIKGQRLLQQLAALWTRR